MKEQHIRPTKLLTMNVSPDIGQIEYQELALTHNGKYEREEIILREFLRTYPIEHPDDPIPHTVVARDEPADFELQDAIGHIVVEIVQINEDALEDIIEKSYTELHRTGKDSHDKIPLELKPDPLLGPRKIAAMAYGAIPADTHQMQDLVGSEQAYQSSLPTVSRKHPDRKSLAMLIHEQVIRKNDKYRDRYPGIRKFLLIDNHTTSFSSFDAEVTERAMITHLLNSDFDGIFMLRLLCVDPKHPDSYVVELKNNRCSELASQVIREVIWKHLYKSRKLLPMHVRLLVQ